MNENIGKTSNKSTENTIELQREMFNKAVKKFNLEGKDLKVEAELIGVKLSKLSSRQRQAVKELVKIDEYINSQTLEKNKDVKDNSEELYNTVG
jgi:hypothetical protein